VSFREGATGPEVGELHQALLERGQSIAQAELDAEAFGPATLAAVQAFQRAASLEPDGVVGPKTQAALRQPPQERERLIAPGWRCEPSQVRAAVRPAVQAALLDLARPVVEDPPGSNRGPHVDRYGVPGLPWCAAAVSTWIMRADGHPLRRALNSALKWREAAKAAGWLLGPTAQPQPGDVGMVLRANLHGHVGLVVHVLDDGRLCSIEGNVGNAVRGLVRPRSAWGYFARPVP
jgi:hypothetical protein